MGAFNPRSPDIAAAICAARSDTVKEVIFFLYFWKNVKDIKKKIVYCFVEKKNWLEFRNMVWG